MIQNYRKLFNVLKSICLIPNELPYKLAVLVKTSPEQKTSPKKMKLLKIFTLASMVAAGPVSQDNAIASSASSNAAEPRQRRFLVSQNDL